MNKKELNDVLDRHKKWLRKEEGGEAAYLRGADLRGADLRDADLKGAYLRDTDLSHSRRRRLRNLDCLQRRALAGLMLMGRYTHSRTRADASLG